jgi:AcrR family transcriptional regulator
MGLRERKREHTIQVILEAAADVFGASGYHGASMEDIAKATGCATATLYGYFKSKEELFTRLLTQRMADYLQGVQEATDQTTGFWEGVDAYFAYFVEHSKRHEAFNKVLLLVMRAPTAGLHPDPEDADAFNQAYLGLVCSIVQRGIDEGILKATSPIPTAVNITGMLHANWFASLLEPLGHDLAVGVANIKSLLLGGVSEVSS